MFLLLGGLSAICFYIAVILFFDVCEDLDRYGHVSIDLRIILMLVLWCLGGIAAVSAIFG